MTNNQNKIEKFAEDLKPHIENHKGKDNVELYVRLPDGKFYRLSGGISTYGDNVVFMVIDPKVYS